MSRVEALSPAALEPVGTHAMSSVGARLPELVWIVLSTAGIAGVGAYFLVGDRRLQDLVFDLYGLAAVVAILVGIRAYRPARHTAWSLLALGVALEAAGDLTLSLLGSGSGQDPFPSAADGLYLAGYAALALAVVQLTGGDGRRWDRTAWVDALTLAGAAAVMLWTVVFDRYLVEVMISPIQTAVAVAYPTMDLVLLAVTAHLLIVSQRGHVGLALIALGFGLNLFSDTWYLLLSSGHAYQVGQAVDAGWLLGYLAWGAAAVHPSMVSVGERSDEMPGARGGATRLRIALLAIGAVVAPTAALAALAQGVPLDMPAVLTGTALLYLLVLSRVVLSLRQQEELARESARLASVLGQYASRDPLTGVASRAAFLEALQGALDRRVATGIPVAVLFLDVDRLKRVNDQLGHAAGDELLTSVAQRLRDGIRSANIVGRLGGDEFGILLEGEDEDSACAVAARVNTILLAPIAVAGRPHFLSASVGVAIAQGVEDAAEMLRRADAAMYEAKSSGGAAHVLYVPQLDAATRERQQIEADLRMAIRHDELALYYQPIVELSTGHVTGLEALIRWQHPHRGLLLPGAFLPVAAAGDLLEPIERWVWRTAIAQAAAWRHSNVSGRSVMVDINMSAQHVVAPGLVEELAEAMATSGLGRGRITLELTETDLVQDAELVGRTIEALRHAGMRVVIDDFGTAYASMSYLADFPVDGIKIDHGFVAALGTGPCPRATLVGAMVNLARGLGISVVAEGVETEGQAQALSTMGCRHAQGFLFGHPLPVAEAARLLAVGRVEPAAVGALAG